MPIELKTASILSKPLPLSHVPSSKGSPGLPQCLQHILLVSTTITGTVL